MAERKRWTVTASGDKPLKKVAQELTKLGFAVDPGGTLSEIGVITGAASDAVAKRLRSVAGVADVSPEPQVDIGPPDAEIS